MGDGNALDVVVLNGGPAIVGLVTNDCVVSNDDDYVAMSFNFRITNAPDDASGFRFGLYHNNGTAVSQDESGSASDDDVGYVARVASGSSAGVILAREAGTDADLTSGSDLLEIATNSTFNLAEGGANHVAELRVTKLTNGVLVEALIDTTTVVSYADTTGYFTNFNEVGIGAGTNVAYLLDNVQVVVTPLRLLQTGWTNVSSFDVEWSTNRVVDASGVSEFRVTTNGITPTNDLNGSSVGVATQATVTITNVGVVTNFVFARDADGDRPEDQQRGNSVKFITRYDNVSPAQVSGLIITNTATQDEATEIRLGWTALTNAGERSDGAVLSPWRSYKLYYEECDGCSPTNYLVYTNGPLDLAAISTTNMVLSNLAFDATYTIQMAGLDSAGNEGPRSAAVITNTIGFVATQGVARLTNDMYVSWTGKVGRAYDVIYFDRLNGWSNGVTNAWSLMELVTNSVTMIDTGTPDRVHPASLGSTMRFYRVASQNAWQPANSPRRATREVYVSRALRLVPGENWVSLFYTPDTNTVAYVLGTNRLPRSTTQINSTKVSWYSMSGTATVQQIIWLSTNSGWLWFLGGAGSANSHTIDIGRAFNIELPPTVPTQRLVLIGQVPTNNPVKTRTLPAHAYSFVGLPMPVRTPLETALNGLQLTGDPTNSMNSDEIRVLATNGVGSFSSPRARIWYRSSDSTYRYFPTYGSPAINAGSSFMVEPGEMIIIYSKMSGTAKTWTNSLLYSAPTKNISP